MHCNLKFKEGTRGGGVPYGNVRWELAGAYFTLFIIVP